MADAAKPGPVPKGWRRRGPPDRPAKAAAASRRGDLTVAALGVTLGLTCALFPWYIFLNPEKFATGGSAGIALVPGLGGGPKLLSPPGSDDGVAALGGGVPIEQLDLFATGSTAERSGDAQAPSAAEQPFPQEPPRFRVVHIENGRAMIADDSGFFVVGRGDRLPDNSRVARIEKRGGKMVVITSTDAVLEVTAQ
jgi:hypothetical protein